MTAVLIGFDFGTEPDYTAVQEARRRGPRVAGPLTPPPAAVTTLGGYSLSNRDRFYCSGGKEGKRISLGKNRWGVEEVFWSHGDRGCGSCHRPLTAAPRMVFRSRREALPDGGVLIRSGWYCH